MSDRIDDGGPAFPRTGAFNEEADSSFDAYPQEGMTLHQWYAGNAPDVPDWFFKDILEQAKGVGIDKRESVFFRWRWYYADQMIKEGNI